MSMCAILSGGVKRHRNIAKRSFLFLDLDCMNKIRAHKKTNPSEAVIFHKNERIKWNNIIEKVCFDFERS